jgi:transposase
MAHQSGQWRGKSFIQGGRKIVRDALYMPALVAMRHNPDLRAKYQALIKTGKPPKVALTALMRELIELANALIKAERNWVKRGA